MLSVQRRCALSALLLFSAIFPGRGQQSVASDEENLVRAIQVQPDLSRRLELLDRWRQKYPSSARRQERYQMTLAAQQQLGLGKEMLRTAYEMAGDDPGGPGAYWLASLTVSERETSPAILERAGRAARTLLDESKSSPDVAHRALGWIALCRRQWREAETEFRIVLLHAPGDAEAAYWMGTAIIGEGPGRESQAYYLCARALAVTGPLALSPAEKQHVRQYLESAYIRRYGSRQGLDQLYARASRGPTFPSNLR
jgi:hypothetical protein